MKSKPEVWSPDRIDNIRQAILREPHIHQHANHVQPEYKEWQWRGGPVYTKTTRGRATCVGCGQVIPRDTSALYAIDQYAGPGAGWTSVGRFLHLECPK